MDTLTKWLDYIQHLHHQRIDMGLERVCEVARRLELTQFNFPVITVAGTNGKGSVVRLLETIYCAAGYRVGASTSPHILRFNERLRINGDEASDQDFMQTFAKIEHARQGISLSFFEFTTLAHLLILQETSLDVIILEVGLGGRLDAMNVVENDVAVITSIDLDHQEYLGNTRAAIAKEKAGIIKCHKTVVCGEQNPPAVIADIAQQRHAVLYQIDRDFSYQWGEGSWDWRCSGLVGRSLDPAVKPRDDVRTAQRDDVCTAPRNEVSVVPHVMNSNSRGDASIRLRDGVSSGAVILKGLNKPILKSQNAATALMVVETLQPTLPVTKEQINLGLSSATLPGRFEVIKNPAMILDVAHNPQATQWLAEQLGQLANPPTTAVVGMLKDKMFAESLKPLIPYIKKWYVAGLDVERGAKAADLAQALAELGQQCYNFQQIQQAFAAALKEGPILVFGSFYTVAAAYQYIASGSEVLCNNN
jgi:dihydrofolate synthase / folylpolyglutamate synthase